MAASLVCPAYSYPYNGLNDRWVYLHKGQHHEFPQLTYVSGTMPTYDKAWTQTTPFSNHVWPLNHANKTYWLVPGTCNSSAVILPWWCFAGHITDVVLVCDLPRLPRSPDLNHINFHLLDHIKTTNSDDTGQHVWQRIQNAAYEISTEVGVL